MSKKVFVLILVLSVLVTYGVALVDAMIRNSLLIGNVGFPLRFSSATFFSSEDINYTYLILDIAFWFVIIWIVWKVISYFLGRAGR